MKPMTIEETFQAASAVLGNAEELVNEAGILMERGRFARAFTLAHLACEELAKSPVFFTVAILITQGEQLNWQKVDKRLREHLSKIRGGLFVDHMLTPHEDPDADIDILLQGLRAGAREMDRLKNASLYANWRDGRMVKPSEVISEELAQGCLRVAQRRLRMAVGFQEGLLQVTGGTEEGFRAIVEQPEFLDFIQTAQSITGRPDDPEVSDAEGETILRTLLGHPDISDVLSKTSLAMDELLRSEESRPSGE
jgi:AbiV family abortive infection protein